MRHRLYCHLVWTTRGRAPLVDARLGSFLERFIPAVCGQESAALLAFGMVSTQMHLLVRLHPRTSISRLVQRLKGGSSCVADREGHARRSAPLRWAKGYTIESVGWRSVGRVRADLLQQALHHPGEAIAGWRPRLTSYDLAAEAATRQAVPEGTMDHPKYPVP
jgi:REP element-mobilizing transposase RayT